MFRARHLHRSTLSHVLGAAIVLGSWLSVPSDAHESAVLPVKLPSAVSATTQTLPGPPRKILKNGGGAGKHACPAGKAYSAGRCEAICAEGQKWDGKACKPAPVDVAWVVVAPGMVWIRGGSFQMGSDNGDPDEQPSRFVTQRWAFAMDRTEVSAGDFAACVNAGVCAAPGALASADPLESDAYCNWGKAKREKHPMNCVDWTAARGYCEWAGKRLPTEAEWEYAAKGNTTGDFIWGTKWPPPGDVGNLADESAKALLGEGAVVSGYTDNYPTTSPVHASRTNSVGLIEMAGNVQEWVEDAYDPAAYSKGDAYEPLFTTGSERVTRGGSWRTGTREALRASVRTRQQPNWRSTSLGFRCAMTLD